MLLLFIICYMNKNYLWKLLRSFSNLNFAIGILVAIILLCVCGSIIEQDKDLSYYEFNYSKYKNIIMFLGIDHIFQTWWFIVLLLMLICSLLFCTFSTQLPSLKNARRWKFIYNNSSYSNNNSLLTDIRLDNFSYINFIYSLLCLNFFVFYKKSSIYSYKGLYGRVAPIFVHFSIIAILLGSLISLSCSFVVQEIVPKGEIFHLKNIVNSGYYSNLPVSFTYKVNNFFIDYNENNSIKQFFSSLSIYSRNIKLTKNKLISVNDPLRFNSTTFYQTDWQINAIRVRLGSNINIQKSLSQISIGGKSCWLSAFPISSEDKIYFILFNLNSGFIVSDSQGNFIGKVSSKEKFYINNLPIIIDDVITSTGLQVKSDPGISIVYLGFFIMIFSTFMSYVSYSQLWICCNMEALQLIGSTNRASLLFEQDIDYLEKIYYSYLFYIINKHDNKYIIL